MRANTLLSWWRGLLLACALLTTGCASLTPPPGRGKWNRMIMGALQKAETRAGRMLTRNEVLDIVAEAMGRYNIPLNFTPGRGR